MSDHRPDDAPARSDLLRIDDHPAAIAVATRIVAEARRALWIRSLDLEAWLFDHPDLLEALRGLATSGRDVQVQGQTSRLNLGDSSWAMS